MLTKKQLDAMRQAMTSNEALLLGHIDDITRRFTRLLKLARLQHEGISEILLTQQVEFRVERLPDAASAHEKFDAELRATEEPQ